LPLDERVRIYGSDWARHLKELEIKDRHELKQWIVESGLSPDIVFELHDNTPHPDAWAIKGNDLQRSLGAYRTKKGYLACPSTNSHIIVGYYSTVPSFDSRIVSFKLGELQVSHEIMEYRSLEEDLLGKAEFQVEYYPVLFDEHSKKESTITYNKGVGFILELIDYLRGSNEAG